MHKRIIIISEANSYQIIEQVTPMQNLGSFNDPIDLDQQQTNEQQQEQKRLEYESNRKTLYEAHMGSDFDVILAVIKTELPGSEENKNKIIASRIKKFFSSEIKKMNPQCDFFRKRREPNTSNPQFSIISNELILYGVDFLSTKQIRAKFEGLSLQITWIDDSHCKLKFPNQIQATAGIQKNLLDCPQNKIKQNQREQMQLPSGWYQFHPYNYMTYSRKLQCRYSSTLDNQVEIKRSNEYYMMQEAKRQFENSLKSEFTQDKYLKTMLKYNFIDDQSYKRMLRATRGDSNNKWNRQDRRGQNRENMSDGNRFSGRYGRDAQGEQEGRGRRGNFEQQRNRGYKNEGSLQNVSQSRSRNKNNANNRKDLDNLSIVSRANSRVSNKSRKSNLSLSYADQRQSPNNKQKDEEDDDKKSSLSFLLSRSEISNGRANQVMNQIKNMRFDDMSIASSHKSKANLDSIKKKIDISFSSQHSQSKHAAKAEEQDLSIDLSMQDGKPMRKNKNNSLSIIQIPE